VTSLLHMAAFSFYLNELNTSCALSCLRSSVNDGPVAVHYSATSVSTCSAVKSVSMSLFTAARGQH